MPEIQFLDHFFCCCKSRLIIEISVSRFQKRRIFAHVFENPISIHQWHIKWKDYQWTPLGPLHSSLRGIKRPGTRTPRNYFSSFSSYVAAFKNLQNSKKLKMLITLNWGLLDNFWRQFWSSSFFRAWAYNSIFLIGKINSIVGRIKEGVRSVPFFLYSFPVCFSLN